MSHHSITYKSEEEAEGGKSLKQGLRLVRDRALHTSYRPRSESESCERGNPSWASGDVIVSKKMRGTAPEVIIEVGWKVNEEDNLVEASDKELLQEVDVPLVVDHEVTDLVQEGDSIWIKEGGLVG
ncbi:hypothetical protein GW17_00038122 [Ensete ventricosum]|nr:hypothetical protein GW17_00038122 [Ensete ventricosum]RZS15633.1 hypothetical protein BHM03_00047494 [Ensete ventricosum]